MRIAIFGLGYVGLTTAGCLCKSGHSVVGVDVSEQKVVEINSGRSPISEPGLEELLVSARQTRRLQARQEAAGVLDDCDMALVCVGTPSAPDGSHNMSFIAEVSRQIAQSVNPRRARPLTVVYRSTIRPGTIEELVEPVMQGALGTNADCVELVYNPEFLRESVAISDYFKPPKIVIGTRDGQRSAQMDALYADIQAPVFYTRYREAELTKFVDNAFHAVKVTFANEIGRVCMQLGLSAAKVHEILIADTKLNISPYYLRPGGAFGGSCLPKDVRALQYISNDIGAQTHLVDSLLRSNEAHKRFLFEHCVKGVAPGASVLMIGLAFKPNSDDLRESPNLDLARRLLQGGFALDILDPALDPRKLVGQNLGYAYVNLPTLSKLLASPEVVAMKHYDLAIDTNGTAGAHAFRAARTVNVNVIA